MSPIVSVDIPTFNRNELCERAVKSVLQQSIPCEIIVVDDGSKEPFQFAEVLGTHTIKLLRTSSNRGVSAARNYGVREASTGIICFLDSDDVWLPDKLAYQLKAYEKYAGKRAIVSGWVRRDPHNTNSAIVIPREPRNRDEYFMGCWYAPGSTLMVNKNIFERIGPFNECLNRLEDYEWFIRFGLSQGDIVL